MSRTEIFRARAVALIINLLLIVDLLGDFVLSVVLLAWAVATKQEGSPPCAFETMSARAGRAYMNRKLWGRISMPAIDAMFAWQSHVAKLPDGRAFEHPSHCIRAFVRTRHLAYLPREYSGPLPPSLEGCYRKEAG